MATASFQLVGFLAVSVTAEYPISSWDVGLQFYGDGSKALSTAILPCAQLTPAASSPATIRPRGDRIVVDSACRPALGSVDAGVCVQLPSQGRVQVACLPSLVIFGFQKCGTGELQGWLSAHPVLHRWQGNLPQKSGAGEPDFFNHLGSSSKKMSSHTWIENYLRAGFILTKPSDATRQYTFEKSPNYGHMGLEKIALMHSLLPSLKLIALVREPTARAYSGFQHTCMKGRVFHVNTDLGMSSKSEARNLLRRELAGRIVIAENKTQAVEGLYLRFGRFAIFEVHLRQLEYPCPPSAFDDFLMLPNAVSDQQSPQRSASIPIQPHLNEEVQESLLDVREDKVGGTSLSSILSHGLYAKAISEFQTLYRPEQLLTVFTEEMQSDLLQTLDKVMAFLGIPQFDYKPFAHRNAPGGVVATFQRSKTATSSYLPMSQRARQVLEAFYAQPNLDLAKLLGDNRVESLWTR